jgi:hypothetical protein
MQSDHRQPRRRTIAQGVTADTGHALIGENATRALVYVAMTRGRHANTTHLYQSITGAGEYGSQLPSATNVAFRGHTRAAAGAARHNPRPARPNINHRTRLRRTNRTRSAARWPPLASRAAHDICTPPTSYLPDVVRWSRASGRATSWTREHDARKNRDRNCDRGIEL